MEEPAANHGPARNTDREIWRERPDDYYADSIHVTEGGGIGINCGGHVVVKPVREWHALGMADGVIATAVRAGETAERERVRDLIAQGKVQDLQELSDKLRTRP